MTVPNETNRVDVTLNGATTVIPYTFRILDASHIEVSIRDLADVETVLTYPTHYAVTGVGSYSGGNVTLVTTYPNGYHATVRRIVPITQTANLRNQEGYHAEVVEDISDKLTQIDQSQQDEIDRSIKIPRTWSTYNTEILGEIEEGEVLGYTGGRFKGLPAASADLAIQLADSSDVAHGDALVAFKQPLTGATARTWHDKGQDFVSIKDFGATGDGVTDDTSAIDAGISAYDSLKFPSGDYLYSGTATPTITKMVLEHGSDIIGMKNLTTSIVSRDKEYSFIGIQHNYNEYTNTSSPILTGDLLSPPISSAIPSGCVDVLAHWYHGFGLEAIRYAGGSLGAVNWYTWYWNHTTTITWGAYDPQRHPMLGWYRGDDEVILDWQCYWLKEAGVAGVIIDIGENFSTASWSSPIDVGLGYPIYQLFNNTPNFKNMKYIINGPYTGASGAILTAKWEDVTDMMLNYPWFYTLSFDNKLYPCVFLWDAGTMRTGVFGTDALFETFLKDMATKFQTAGYGGVCVFMRNGTYYTSAANAGRYYQAFYGTGVICYESTYGAFPGTYSSPTSYSDFVNGFDTAYAAVSNRYIPNVLTSRFSKYHPTGWTTSGSTPELFAEVLQKASIAAQQNVTIPPIVTVYNVSEWGEGGPGLQPNVYDGWGYLDAVAKITGITKQAPNTYGYTKQVNSGTSTANNNIKPIGDLVRIYASAGITLNGTYVAYQNGTIAVGYDGQKIKLINVATLGDYAITICDVSSYANSNLYLTAATITLNAWDSVELTYITGKGWVQTGSYINIL